MPFVLDALRLGGPRVPLAPNATLQAPPIAEARNERRLLAVACKRLLGGVGRPPTAPRRPGVSAPVREEHRGTTTSGTAGCPTPPDRLACTHPPTPAEGRAGDSRHGHQLPWATDRVCAHLTPELNRGVRHCDTLALAPTSRPAIQNLLAPSGTPSACLHSENLPFHTPLVPAYYAL